MPRSYLEYLRHISDEIKFILNISKNLSYAEFENDEILKRAAVRSIEIIGEATKKIPTNFRDKYSHIDWRSISGMRDKLIHNYFGIDYEIVWDVMLNKIPVLKKEIDKIIQNETTPK